MQRLHEEGVPPRLIAPAVGMSQRTVERWLTAGGVPEHRRPPMASMLNPFRFELERCWNAGCPLARNQGAGLQRQLANRRTLGRCAPCNSLAGPGNTLGRISRDRQAVSGAAPGCSAASLTR